MDDSLVKIKNTIKIALATKNYSDADAGVKELEEYIVRHQNSTHRGRIRYGLHDIIAPNNTPKAALGVGLFHTPPRATDLPHIQLEKEENEIHRSYFGGRFAESTRNPRTFE